MSDPEQLEKELGELRVSEVFVKFAARRSIRAVGANGDEFRTAEAEETWKVTHPAGPMSVDLAYASALKFTPLLVKKVMFDLVVAGVMKQEEAKSRIEYAKASYAKALGLNQQHGPSTEQEADSGTLRSVGDPLSAAGKEPSEGSDLHQGQDHRVSTETGSGDGPASGSQETPSGGEDRSP
jgi:hypothetical protein